MLGLRRANFIATGRRKRAFGRCYGPLQLLLSLTIAILLLLLRSLDSRRSFVPWLIAIVRLLIIPLLISAGRWRGIIAPLLFDRPLLVRPGVLALIVVVAKVRRLP